MSSKMVPIGAVLAGVLSGAGGGVMMTEGTPLAPERVEVPVPAMIDHESIRMGTEQALAEAFQRQAGELVRAAREATPRVVYRDRIPPAVTDAWNRAYTAAPPTTQGAMTGKLAPDTSAAGFARALESLARSHARLSAQLERASGPSALEQYRARQTRPAGG